MEEKKNKNSNLRGVPVDVDSFPPLPRLIITMNVAAGKKKENKDG